MSRCGAITQVSGLISKKDLCVYVCVSVCLCLCVGAHRGHTKAWNSKVGVTGSCEHLPLLVLFSLPLKVIWDLSPLFFPSSTPSWCVTFFITVPGNATFYFPCAEFAN